MINKKVIVSVNPIRFSNLNKYNNYQYKKTIKNLNLVKILYLKQ